MTKRRIITTNRRGELAKPTFSSDESGDDKFVQRNVERMAVRNGKNDERAFARDG